MENNKFLSLKVESISSHLIKMIIQVGNETVETIQNQAVKILQRKASFSGIKNQNVPSEYVENNYRVEIDNYINNFLFKYSILDFLMEQIRSRKISLTNYPRLNNIQIDPNKQINFHFDISLSDPIELKEWKNFIFRAPKRKRYKDLDKQVAFFLKKEISLFKQKNQDCVEEKDWVLFDAELLDESGAVLPNFVKSSFWTKLNNHNLIKPFQFNFLGKKINEQFVTNLLPLENIRTEEIDENNFNFLITIKAINKGSNFCLDSFRNTFKLKSKIDVHKKLVEVFSYKNDLSQRKSIIEELFHLFLSKHRFEVPKHFIIRRQEDILLTLKKHPDYHVYKQQKDFVSQIESLAEKQLKEEILIDQLAYKENIKVEEKDMQNYLYFFNSNRLKEFIYFKPLLEKIDDSTTLIQTATLKQAILREKTLNYIIYILTK